MPMSIHNTISFSTLIDSLGVLVAWNSFGREYGFGDAAAAHDGHAVTGTLAQYPSYRSRTVRDPSR